MYHMPEFMLAQFAKAKAFLFCRVVTLKTVPRGNFSHPYQTCDADHIHQLANTCLSLSRNANLL